MKCGYYVCPAHQHSNTISIYLLTISLLFTEEEKMHASIGNNISATHVAVEKLNKAIQMANAKITH